MNLMIQLLADIPIPRDIPLPLPAGRFALLAWLVPVFLMHLFFVNLMLGGSILSTVYEIVGIRHKKYDSLALLIANTITVNKSMAVVLGVGPLLIISLTYTAQFYTTNALTGYAWILIVPIVTVAFLLTYLHKYTWERWTGPAKRWHIAVGIAANLLLLMIPFIFLANINLMNYPDQWAGVKGFFSTLPIGNGNLFLRLAHFLMASIAVTAIFLGIWLTRSAGAAKALGEDLPAPVIWRHFYRMALYVSMVQLLVGPTLLLILPRVGISFGMVVIILSGAVLAILMMLVIAKELRSPEQRIGRRWPVVVILLGCVAMAMGSGRQLYRFVALVDHQNLMAANTLTYERSVDDLQLRIKSGVGLTITGRELFAQTCATCHMPGSIATAPSIEEVRGLYGSDTAKMIAWAKAPQKRRPQYVVMPSFAALGDEKLKLISEYYLGLSYDVRGEIVKLPAKDGPREIVIRHEIYPQATGIIPSAEQIFSLEPTMTLDALAVGDKVSIHFAAAPNASTGQILKIEKLPVDTKLKMN